MRPGSRGSGQGPDWVSPFPHQHTHHTSTAPQAPSSGVEPMSLTPTAPGPVAGVARQAGDGPRRVRHQARDVVALMAFSATTSTALAAGLLLLAHLSHAAGR